MGLLLDGAVLHNVVSICRAHDKKAKGTVMPADEYIQTEMGSFGGIKGTMITLGSLSSEDLKGWLYEH